ncbi:MAG: GNAT family N-acetyltransferase [Candidatus Hydrogenedentes bacterium]|nr:GNAT family N-acetyltransferase [Candidatus Hydrogenedentota bacterium]
MEMKGRGFTLRAWQRGDEAALVRHANNWNVARTLSAIFPHPYTREDAESYIGKWCDQEPPERVFAVVVEGEPAGCVGLHGKEGELARTCEIGYWLSEEYWGRGIMTEVVGMVTAYAFEVLSIERLEARVFAVNAGSARVLEKNGYQFEGRLRRRVFRDGRLDDELVYAVVRGE